MEEKKTDMDDKELKRRLTPEQYKIVVEKGTEVPGTGEYLHNKEKGMYRCVVCGAPLFSSETKYDSGTGWPSFYAPASNESVATNEDQSHGMDRTEVVCQNCGAHLGHVFNDGPKPTGKHFCVNSRSLTFDKERRVKDE